MVNIYNISMLELSLCHCEQIGICLVTYNSDSICIMGFHFIGEVWQTLRCESLLFNCLWLWFFSVIWVLMSGQYDCLETDVCSVYLQVCILSIVKSQLLGAFWLFVVGLLNPISPHIHRAYYIFKWSLQLWSLINSHPVLSSCNWIKCFTASESKTYRQIKKRKPLFDFSFNPEISSKMLLSSLGG